MNEKKKIKKIHNIFVKLWGLNKMATKTSYFGLKYGSNAKEITCASRHRLQVQTTPQCR